MRVMLFAAAVVAVNATNHTMHHMSNHTVQHKETNHTHVELNSRRAHKQSQPATVWSFKCTACPGRWYKNGQDQGCRDACAYYGGSWAGTYNSDKYYANSGYPKAGSSGETGCGPLNSDLSPSGSGSFGRCCGCSLKCNCNYSPTEYPTKYPSQAPTTLPPTFAPEQEQVITVEVYGHPIQCAKINSLTTMPWMSRHGGTELVDIPSNLQTEDSVLCVLPEDIAEQEEGTPDPVEVTCNAAFCDVYVFQFAKAGCPGGDASALKTDGWCTRYFNAAPVVKDEYGRSPMKAFRKQFQAGSEMSLGFSRMYTVIAGQVGTQDPAGGSSWCLVPNGAGGTPPTWASGCLE